MAALSATQCDIIVCRFTIPVPVLTRLGGRKMVFENFWQVAAAMNREQELLRQFFSSSLSAQCTLAPAANGIGNFKMVMRTRILPREVETLLTKFLSEYVASPGIPGSFHTRLERDAATGLQMVVCNETGSRRCIARHTRPRG